MDLESCDELYRSVDFCILLLCEGIVLTVDDVTEDVSLSIPMSTSSSNSLIFGYLNKYIILL